MPLYFFDTAAGDNDRDNVGVDLPNKEAARAEAIKYLA